MSMKAFYLVGVVATAMAVTGAVTVFAADPPAAKAPPAPAATAAAKPAPAKDTRKAMRMETPTFVDLDTNHDGSISPAEFDAYRNAHKGLQEADPRGPEGRGPEGRGPEGRGFEGRGFEGRGQGAWGGPPMMMRMERRFGGRGEGPGGMPGMESRGDHALDLLDANNDGKLSFDEMVAPLKRHFERMDTNHDGFLSKDEMHKGHEWQDGDRKKPDGQTPPPPPGQ